jgi:hypothetical protein
MGRSPRTQRTAGIGERFDCGPKGSYERTGTPRGSNGEQGDCGPAVALWGLGPSPEASTVALGAMADQMAHKMAGRLRNERRGDCFRSFGHAPPKGSIRQGQDKFAILRPCSPKGVHPTGTGQVCDLHPPGAGNLRPPRRASAGKPLIPAQRVRLLTRAASDLTETCS